MFACTAVVSIYVCIHSDPLLFVEPSDSELSEAGERSETSESLFALPPALRSDSPVSFSASISGFICVSLPSADFLISYSMSVDPVSELEF